MQRRGEAEGRRGRIQSRPSFAVGFELSSVIYCSSDTLLWLGATLALSSWMLLLTAFSPFFGVLVTA